MTILEEIVSRTAEELRTKRSRVSDSDLRGLPLFDDPRRSFRVALSGEGLAVIAEIKAASPSKGVIRADLDVPWIASQYADAGAAAISVLTEPHFFHGQLEHLGVARSASSTPLLRKDFVIDPYQVVEARAHGADAVLLIAACLERSQMGELLHACEELGLEHLVELYELRDLDKIDVDHVSVIGVNSRDLHTFEVDLDRLVTIFNEIPEGIVRVAESGISDGADLKRVIAAPVDAILVGESLMRADQPGEALRLLLETARTIEKKEAVEDNL